MLAEWIDFRQATVQRRTQHRLGKVLDRIHILEGRQLVLLNIDEVIRIIRNADEPKPALIERFRLSDRQAEDILEIRLRQLARLEAIKIEQELKSLRERAGQAGGHPRQPGGAEAHADQGDRGRCQGARRRAPHAGAGRKARGRRDQGGRRAGDRGRQPQGLGAGAEGPRGRPGHAGLQGRRCAVRHLRLPQRRHAAGLRQRGRRQRTGLQRGRGLAARRPRRRRSRSRR